MKAPSRSHAIPVPPADPSPPGLDPGVSESLLGRWEFSDAQLNEAARQIGAGEPLAELFALARA